MSIIVEDCRARGARSGAATGAGGALATRPDSGPAADRAAARDRDRRHVIHPWTPLSADRSELLLVRGLGYRVWDADGREYLDASSAALHAVCGYAHPVLTEAIACQLGRLHHVDLSRAGHEPAGLLAERLASYLPPELCKTLFVNSGSEGFDAAALIAAGYWDHRGQARDRMVAFRLGYHGSTVLSRSLSGLARNRHPLRSPVRVSLVDLPFEPRRMREPEALAALLGRFEAAIGAGPAPAAVVVEPFLNVGGGIVLPAGFLAGLRELCDAAGTLLIVDEVFTAYGRGGHMFHCAAHGVVPDILVSSKGLTGGYVPMAAVTVAEHVYASFAADPVVGGIRYGHTCSGHAVGAAAALATLDVLEKDDLIAEGARMGERLRARLAGLAGRGAVLDVRGIGLAVVVETATEQAASSAMDRAQRAGLLIRRQGPEGRSLLLAPPLILDAAGADAMAERLESALT